VFEGIREKVENKQQYQAYLEELKNVREELGEPYLLLLLLPCSELVQASTRRRTFTSRENAYSSWA
jgi:hypothetical protein